MSSFYLLLRAKLPYRSEALRGGGKSLKYKSSNDIRKYHPLRGDYFTNKNKISTLSEGVTADSNMNFMFNCKLSFIVMR